MPDAERPHLNCVLFHSELVQLAGNHMGVQDAPCPRCGPERRSPANRRRKVLRIWRISPSFATYRCARCDAHGYAREDGAPASDPLELAESQDRGAPLRRRGCRSQAEKSPLALGHPPPDR